MKRIIASAVLTLSILSGCSMESVPANTDYFETTETSETEIADDTNITETEKITTDTDVAKSTEVTEATEETTVTTTEPSPYGDINFEEEIPSSYYIGAEVIYQNPELPTGCEITSLAMLLNYWGYDIDKVELSDNYLNKNYDYSCTFYDAFIGNPTSDSGFGCYSPVIEDAAYSFLRVAESDLEVYNITGLSLDDVFHYIALDRPVVIWASMSLVDVHYYHAWTTDSGEEAWWYENEHCMLLTGYDYDNGTVTVCDPLKGEYTYDMYRFEEVFNQLEQQAVTIF